MSDTRVAAKPYIIGPTSSFFVVPTSGNLAPWGTGDGVLEAWYDISDASTITFSVPGVRISDVADKSGKGRNATATGLADPTYIVPAQNGLNGAGFPDADAPELYSSSFTAVNEPYMYMCAFIPSGGTRSEPRLWVNNAIAWWKHTGIFGGDAGVFISSGLDAAATCSVGTAYWLQAIFTGGATTFVRLSTGTKQTGNPGSATLSQVGFGPAPGVGLANERVNATLLEEFWISNPSASDEANAKTYIGNKWALPTS